MAMISSRRKVLLPLLALLAGCGTMPGLAGPDAAAPSARGKLTIPRLLPDDGDRIPAGYYRDAEGKEGQALLVALHRIVAKHSDLGYDKARDTLFGRIADSDDDDSVADLYTGQERGGIRDRRTAYDKGMNTEHTWPQSLGAEGAAKADLHHLQPSDIAINGARSSYPYGEVTGKAFATWPGVDGNSAMGNSPAGYMVFQPRPSVRGNIARGLFYFYTTYGVEGGSRLDLRNFRLEAPVLVKWHQDDPVDTGERARNDAVFEAQGNRNPFVDHPDWAKRVGPLPGR